MYEYSTVIGYTQIWRLLQNGDDYYGMYKREIVTGIIEKIVNWHFFYYSYDIYEAIVDIDQKEWSWTWGIFY